MWGLHNECTRLNKQKIQCNSCTLVPKNKIEFLSRLPLYAYTEYLHTLDNLYCSTLN